LYQLSSFLITPSISTFLFIFGLLSFGAASNLGFECGATGVILAAGAAAAG
jgi:hypothetical protein